MNRPHKYGAKATVVDGIRFDSKAEARRYGELKLMEKARAIRSLCVHPAYKIIHNGQVICDVEPDFAYQDIKAQKVIYEDVKGMDTPMSRLKRKLLKAFYGIDVTLVK